MTLSLRDWVVLLAAIGVTVAITVGVYCVPSPPPTPGIDMSDGSPAAKAAAKANAAAKKAKAEAMSAAAAMINLAGYDCREIDSLHITSVSPDVYTARCNDYRYTFYLENHGGKWSVKSE